MGRFFPFFKHYPGTNLHEIDLDYVLRESDEAYQQTAALTEWADQHQEEYEHLKDRVDGLVNNLVDVISPWDSSIAYHIYSIVEYQGTNYIAIQDVPVGAMITNTDYWQPANTTVEQINAIGDSVSEMQSRIYTMIPDDFEGTDTEKLQQCLDFFTGKPGGTIVINRPYTVTADLIIRHRSFYGANQRVTIIGQGKTAALNMQGYSFRGDSEEGVHNYGNVCFMNLNMKGTGSLFNMDTLIRVYLINCALENFEHVFYTTGYIQSCIINDCSIRDITGTIFEAEGGTYDNALIDVHLINSLVEHCTKIFDSYYISLVTVERCCIEAFHNIPFTLRGYVRCFNLTDNYFESNANGYNDGDTDYHGVNVDMSAINVNSFMQVNIKDNFFSQKVTDTVIVMPDTSTSYGCISIRNNSAPRDLIMIKGSSTLTMPYRNIDIAGNVGQIEDPNELIYKADEPIERTIERSAPNITGTFKVRRTGSVVTLTGKCTITGGIGTYTLVTGNDMGNMYYTTGTVTDQFVVYDVTNNEPLIATWSAGGALTAVTKHAGPLDVIVNTSFLPVIR